MEMVLVVYHRLFFDGFQKKFSYKYLVSVPSSKSEVKRYVSKLGVTFSYNDQPPHLMIAYIIKMRVVIYIV